MISLCPACKTEQMVTAIALQEKRGLVCCEACAEAFKPRAHRVTPSREKAFKKRLKDLQLAMEATPEEIVISPVHSHPAEDCTAQRGTAELNAAGFGDAPSDDPGNVERKRGDSDPDATRRLIEELGQSVITLNKQIGARISQAVGVIEQGKNLQNDESGTPAAASNSKTMAGPPNAAQLNAAQRAGRAGPSIQQSLAPNTSDIMRTSIKPQPAPLPDNGAPNQSQLSSEGRQMKHPSHTLSPEAIQRNRMRKERHAIARQKLLLEYEKLKVENEKLTVEKKKIELEKVKLEIMARQQLLDAKRVDPFASKGPALDGRPVVEYDITTDLLPRTPNAIDHGTKQLAAKSEKLHLELMPNEPKRLFRKNLASRSKSFKAK